MTPIRVLHLVSSLAIEGPLGGVARYAVDLCRAFDRAQVQPRIVALWDYQTPYERQRCADLWQEGIPAAIGANWDESTPYRSCVRALQGLWHAPLGSVDVIHSHGEFSDLAALALRRRLGARAVVRTVHNEIEWAKRPLYGRIFGNLLYPLTFDAELGISQQVASNLTQRRLARLRDRQAPVMYNALDFERFTNISVDRTDKLAGLTIPADATVIGTIGRLTRQKGYDVLLNAIPVVLRERPGVVFLIIGDGVLRPDLEAQARQLGVESSVRFVGLRRDVEELLLVMDLFVSSSRWEGLPTVLLESIAAGVPVVATAVSGTVELVQDGINGLLVPPDDAEALAASIVRALAERDQLMQGVARMRQDVQARFSLSSIAGHHVALYRDLLNTVIF